MDATIRELRREELLTAHGGRFDEENAERVTKWLVAAEDRRPVLLVGAGYSRNARDRETGMTATQAQAPLWNDLIKSLAADVDLPVDHYDAPTLFELYGETLGEARLRDALRGCFADSALGPGPAHEAIATYPCEAIVTTNCLDTLLDKVCAVGWRRVIENSDLSVQGQLRDLIYLHGHRDYADSWVMTRSQYEDFHRTKPVIVARTRQLLAQHPWLVVGFGMTDPNFHSITRLVGSEMRGQQPLSLVLMPKLPSTAERQHWRRLGFEIVAPERAEKLPDFFAWALSKLTTTYSPTSEAASAYIGRTSSAGERLRRFRAVNPAPIDKQSVYQHWEAELEALLTPEERASALETSQVAARAVFGSFARLSAEADGSGDARTLAPPPLQSPILNALENDSELGPVSNDRHVQFLDRLLAGNLLERSILADHFAWALHHQLFEHSDNRPLMEVVTVFLAREGHWGKERIDAVIKEAFGLVRKYEHASVERTLARHIETLGFVVPAPNPAPDEPHLVEAQAGYRAFLNADFEQAAKHYGIAARAAAATRLDLETWAYTLGQADSLASMPKARDTIDLAKALREQAVRLEQSPAVKYWRERADTRLKEALRDSVDEERTRERYRVTGGRGHRSSSGVNGAWRSYRDLLALHAPPWLQRHYLAPVAPFLGAEEVRAVLVSVAKPREWIDALLRLPPASLADRQHRDRQLVDGILSGDASSVTKTEHLAAVECLPKLISVLRTQDVTKALEWLKTTIAHYPAPWQTTALGSHSVGERYWTAFSACAHWAKPADALGLARTLLGQGGSEHDGAARALYALPWSAWHLSTETDIAHGFVEAFTALLPDETTGARRSTEVAYLIFGLLRMLNAGLTAESLLPHLQRWQQALEKLRAEPRSQARYSEGKRAGYMLEGELERRGLVPKQPADRLFAAWFGSDDPASLTQEDREEMWSALAEAVVPDMSPSAPLLQRLSTEVASLISGVDAQKARERYELNPHLAYPAVRLLVRGLRLFPAKRTEIGPELLRLVQAAPDQIDELGPALSKTFWTDTDWVVLRGLFVALCGGGPPQFSSRRSEDPGLSTRCQRAMLTLFGRSDREPSGAAEAPLWSPVQAFALASVNDERLTIAYAAAFSVVQTAAIVADPGDAGLYATALLRIADDPRAEIRSAIARDGVALMKRAQSALIRAAAGTAVVTIRDDNNAQVCALLEQAELREGNDRAFAATTSASTQPTDRKGHDSAPPSEELS